MKAYQDVSLVSVRRSMRKIERFFLANQARIAKLDDSIEKGASSTFILEAPKAIFGVKNERSSFKWLMSKPIPWKSASRGCA